MNAQRSLPGGRRCILARVTRRRIEGIAPLVIVAAVALALRLAYLWELSDSPFGPGYLPIDARDYHAWATGWLVGAWPPHAAFFRPPLYTVFVGIIYQMAGPHPLAVQIAQALLGTASCVLVHGIARELFPRRAVAWLAATACAVCGTLIYFDAQLLSASLDVFLQLLVLWLLLVAARTGSIRWWIAASFGIGFSAINRGAILLFVPFVLVWLQRLPVWRSGGSTEASSPGALFGRRALALMVPAALVIAPVTWHNARYDQDAAPAATASEALRHLARGDFVLIAANSGVNFYLGNHAVLRELNRLEHPDHMHVYDRIRSEPAEIGLTSMAAKNAYLVERTLSHLAEWPREWLQLLGVKLGEIGNGAEIPRNTSIYADRGYSMLLSALLWKRVIAWPSGLIIPLGLVGIGLLHRSWREHFLPWCSLAAQTAFLLAFFVTARYRLPMLPLLAIYAAHALVALGTHLRERRPLDAARLGAAMVALLVLCNLGIGPMERSHSYVEWHDLAVAYSERGKPRRAEAAFARASELEPSQAAPRIGLCSVLLGEARAEEALPHCTRAVELAPRSAKARFLIGKTLEALGRPGESLPHYRRAARLAPEAPGPREALRRVREATRHRPPPD